MEDKERTTRMASQPLPMIQSMDTEPDKQVAPPLITLEPAPIFEHERLSLAGDHQLPPFPQSPPSSPSPPPPPPPPPSPSLPSTSLPQATLALTLPHPHRPKARRPSVASTVRQSTGHLLRAHTAFHHQSFVPIGNPTKYKHVRAGPQHTSLFTSSSPSTSYSLPFLRHTWAQEPKLPALSATIRSSDRHTTVVEAHTAMPGPAAPSFLTQVTQAQPECVPGSSCSSSVSDAADNISLLPTPPASADTQGASDQPVVNTGSTTSRGERVWALAGLERQTAICIQKPRWQAVERVKLLEAIIAEKQLDTMSSFRWDVISKAVGRSKKACKDQWRREILPSMRRFQQNQDPSATQPADNAL